MKKILFVLSAIVIFPIASTFADNDVTERLNTIDKKLELISHRVAALESREQSQWSCAATCRLSWQLTENGHLNFYQTRKSFAASSASASDAFQSIVNQCDQFTKETEKEKGTQVTQEFFVSSEKGTLAPDLKNACVR